MKSKKVRVSLRLFVDPTAIRIILKISKHSDSEKWVSLNLVCKRFSLGAELCGIAN